VSQKKCLTVCRSPSLLVTGHRVFRSKVMHTIALEKIYGAKKKISRSPYIQISHSPSLPVSRFQVKGHAYYCIEWNLWRRKKFLSVSWSPCQGLPVARTKTNTPWSGRPWSRKQQSGRPWKTTDRRPWTCGRPPRSMKPCSYLKRQL